MSGVDVLASMSNAAFELRTITTGNEGRAANTLDEARAAVAELIAASGVIDERIAYYASLGENADQNIEDWAYTDNSGDMARLRAALARVTGVYDGR